MYFVKYGDEYLHNPQTKNCTLIELSLDCDENIPANCDFDIYPNHPMYGKLKKRDDSNPITVYDGNIILFSGYITDIETEMKFESHVTCVGQLDYLKQSRLRPYSTIEKSRTIKAPDTLSEYFEWLISQHNSRVTASKQFKIGVNECYKLSQSKQITAENLEYPTTFDEITEKIIKNFGGFLRVRNTKNERYIDILADWEDKNNQLIEFGTNLTDYTKKDNTEDLATICIATGAKLSETTYYYDNGYFVTSDRDYRKKYYTRNWDEYKECVGLVKFDLRWDYYIYNGGENYFATHDGSPQLDPSKDFMKKYYTKDQDGNYNACGELDQFESGTQYYEYMDGYTAISEDAKLLPPEKGQKYYLRDYSFSEFDLQNSAFRNGQNYYEYDENKDESELLLTLSELDDGYSVDPDFYKADDKIICKSASLEYGTVPMKYENSDLKDARELFLYAGIELAKNIREKHTIEVKAVDLHLIDNNIRPIRLGEYVRIKSIPHNLDTYFACRSISLDLNSPDNSIYSFGRTYDTLTGYQSKRLEELNKTITKGYEKLDENSSIGFSKWMLNNMASGLKYARGNISILQQLSLAHDESVCDLFEYFYPASNQNGKSNYLGKPPKSIIDAYVRRIVGRQVYIWDIPEALQPTIETWVVNYYVDLVYHKRMELDSVPKEFRRQVEEALINKER